MGGVGGCERVDILERCFVNPCLSGRVWLAKLQNKPRRSAFSVGPSKNIQRWILEGGDGMWLLRSWNIMDSFIVKEKPLRFNQQNITFLTLQHNDPYVVSIAQPTTSLKSYQSVNVKRTFVVTYSKQ